MIGPLAWMVFATVAHLPATEEPAFSESTVVVHAGGGQLVLRDMDGNGKPELLQVDPHGISLRRLELGVATDGGLGFPEQPLSTLRWPAESVAWDVADVDADGAHELVLFEDGRRVRSYGPDADGQLTLRAKLVDTRGGYMPPGIRHVRFARDVDDDGRADLVIPGTDRYLVHLAGPDGTWTEVIEVAFRPEIRLDLGDPNHLDEKFGQAVTIPWFTLEDCDGDGRSDLKSLTDSEAAFYIADPTIPSEPTWRLDLDQLEDSRPLAERIDLENVFGVIGEQVNWRFADLDGKPPWDLVLQQGGTFKLFRDGSRGSHLEHPTQVLKSSGNVLYFQLRDVDRDGRTDLQLVRAENVSLGRILRWLVLAGSLDFDVFTYGNTGGSFTRRPIDRKTITLRIPALLGFADEFEAMGDNLTTRAEVPARTACLDGDGRFDDIVDVRDGRVVTFRNRVPPGFEEVDYSGISDIGDIDALVEGMLLDDLDQLEQGATRTLDLAQIDDLVATPGWDLRQLTLALTPDDTHELEPFRGKGEVPKQAGLRIQDLDRNGVSDVIVVTREQERSIVRFLLTRPRE